MKPQKNEADKIAEKFAIKFAEKFAGTFPKIRQAKFTPNPLCRTSGQVFFPLEMREKGSGGIQPRKHGRKSLKEPCCPIALRVSELQVVEGSGYSAGPQGPGDPDVLVAGRIASREDHL